LLVNETAIGPKVNPFKERYWKQFGGGPSPEELKQMDPTRTDIGPRPRPAAKPANQS
jgi:arylsulfatase